VMVALAYAWWVSGLRPFTGPVQLAIVVPGVVVVVLAAVTTRKRGPDRARLPTAGSAAWVVLGVVVVGWQLFNFFHGDRSVHPTPSSLMDEVDAHRTLRTIVFVGWLALGWDLVRR